jgi:tight adherence protein B
LRIVRPKVARLALAALVAAPALAAVSPARAAPAFELRGTDVSTFPVIHLVVRSARPNVRPVLWENGERVTGADFENLGQSKSIVIAIDRSQSMRGRPLAQAASAADGFLLRKRQSDQVAVVTFGALSLAQTSFGQATIDADTALRTLRTAPRLGTALYDAVVLSASELQQQSLPGRVLVLLTDGRDVGSVSRLSDAVRAVKQANVVVYAIALGHADAGPLRHLVKATGGALYFAPTSQTLAAVYRSISSEFDRTWRVSFSTAARPGDTISIAVGRSARPRGTGLSLLIPGHSSTLSHTWIPRALLQSTAGSLLISLAAAVLLFLIVLRLRTLPRSERLKRLVRSHTEPRIRRRKLRQRPSLASIAAAVDQSLRRGQRWQRLERLAGRAGVPVSASTLLFGGVALALALSLIGALATASSFMIVVLFAAGLAAPFVAARIIAKRRVQAFDDQLPEVLATVASTLRVGHGLKAGLQAVANDGGPPASVELRRVLAEARLGRPLDEALISMCERLGSDDLMYVATAVDVQSRVGGSLAGVFETVADTVRQRQQHRRRVRALTASGRASATVLSLLPFVLVGLVSVVNPNYMLPFLRSGVGHVLIVISLISIGIGAFLLSRIANVKG